MSIGKIELDAIASKINVTKEVSKSEDVHSASSVEKGGHVNATSMSKIEFSDNAKILMEAVEAVKNVPDIRLDKINELKAAILQGTYKIDSTKLAEKMVKAHLADR